MAKGLSSGLAEGLRGKAGSVVFVRSRDGGMIVRPYVTPHDPNTAAQQQWRNLRKRAAQGFNALTPAQYTEWQQYAKSLTRVNPQTGVATAPLVYNLYVTLTSKLLQAVPNAALPTVPPTQEFTGDSLRVSVTSGAGTVTFTASAANGSNVVTELLLQPLPSAHRTPLLRSYRPAVFFGFTAGSLSKTVTAKTGWVACAIRFVNTQTGQASVLVEIGKILVG